MHAHQADTHDTDAVETTNIPEIRIEQDISNENNLPNRNSLRSEISDTDYNASAESNESSRRSSVDVPHYQLNPQNINRNHGNSNEIDFIDSNSEVRTLVLEFRV